MKKIFSFLLIIAILSCTIFALPSSALSFDDLGILQVEESEKSDSVMPRAPGGGNGSRPNGGNTGGSGSGDSDSGDSGSDSGEATTNNSGTGNGGTGPGNQLRPGTDTTTPTTEPTTQPPATCTHPNMVFVKAEQQATCSTTGIGLYKCPDCNHVEQSIIPKDPNAHNTSGGTTKKPTCTEPGLQTGGTCKLCGKTIGEQVLPALGHQFSQWTVKKQATATEKGTKERTCLECGFKETAEYTLGDELNLEPSTDVIAPSEQESETYMEDFLEFETETTVPSESLLTRLNIKGSDIAVIVIVLLAMVMVIALLVYVLLLSRRKKEPQPKVAKAPVVVAPAVAAADTTKPQEEKAEQAEAEKPEAEASEQAENSAPETEEVKN